MPGREDWRLASHTLRSERNHTTITTSFYLGDAANECKRRVSYLSPAKNIGRDQASIFLNWGLNGKKEAGQKISDQKQHNRYTRPIRPAAIAHSKMVMVMMMSWR
jgi:hypothetical protein